MEWLLIGVAYLAFPVIRLLPLTWVARLGRFGGALAWLLDRRHRLVALDNLERCFGAELDPAARRRIARENFRRIGENYACAVRTAFMEWRDLERHVEIVGFDGVRRMLDREPGRSVIIALGHFGNFELFTWCKIPLGDAQLATTYRALRQEAATRMLMKIRSRSGCLFFERRRDAAALKEALASRSIVLGLLADQHDGRGVRVPFLGHDAGTSVAPALLALRYHSRLFTGFCFRVGLARWRMEVGDELATHDDAGKRRRIEDIARDMNASFERAVRRDPANWFWVHRRWKPAPQVVPP